MPLGRFPAVSDIIAGSVYEHGVALALLFFSAAAVVYCVGGIAVIGSFVLVPGAAACFGPFPEEVLVHWVGKGHRKRGPTCRLVGKRHRKRGLRRPQGADLPTVLRPRLPLAPHAPGVLFSLALHIFGHYPVRQSLLLVRGVRQHCVSHSVCRNMLFLPRSGRSGS